MDSLVVDIRALRGSVVVVGVSSVALAAALFGQP
jgi:hypothetical protein